MSASPPKADIDHDPKRKQNGPDGPAILRADVAEDDGFVICLTNRHAQNRADLLVLDANDMSGAPLATVPLPFNQPFAFHGSWVPAN
jgi:carotenoid cleavage dioxygenase